MSYGATFPGKLTAVKLRRKTAWIAGYGVRPWVKVSPMRHDTFEAWGEQLPYFVHPYNSTWRNERCIEVALARSFLQKHSGAGMEFGNVLGHYGKPAAEVVVDKYELDAGVLQVDIMDYQPSQPLDYIVGLSTIEHVGWDEPVKDPKKVNKAFARLRSMLAPDGVMLLTAPLGYNPALDTAVTSGAWETIRQACYLKVGHRWYPQSEIRVIPFGERDIWPKSIWVAEIGAH